MAQAHGTCDPKFQGVRDRFQQLLESGQELGASLTVTIDGEEAVNLWGGYADADRTRPWNEDTIVNVWSTTKTIAALAVLLLIDDGQLGPDDKVSEYWPEFAVNGKEDIRVRHLLSHTAGLAAFEDPITFPDLCDFDAAVARLEKQAPQWEPGTASGYHCWTYGFPIGELVRRRTGLGLRDFVSQRIAAPLDADFQIGACEEDWPRVAELVPPPLPPSHLVPPAPDPDSLFAKILRPTPDASFANTAPWRRADIGAANGHSNSRAIAKIWSRALTLADDGRRLLSPRTVDLVFTEQSYGTDLFLGVPARFGTGLGLRGNGDALVDAWLPEGRLCFWGGWGGSMVINDVDRHLTIAYAMNKMDAGSAGNDAVRSYVAEVYKALGVPIPGAGGKL
ncbi:Putative beta-lactamase/transpeptidase [Colletotrichum destructivum]|uniref:Beta-lactamase/transpeptidase n=1 Tax=Colletotrichum destructivum TaxID=34406 RepID=A0AAX4I540_9PEZI|nr:Putative beta-lactamase/transpeptidase [Colletotrichum destructivum]